MRGRPSDVTFPGDRLEVTAGPAVVSGETVELVITPAGNLRAIYDERVDLAGLGRRTIRRGSHVEPTEDGRWTADLAPCDGPLLGPFERRSEALAAEVAWLTEHWLHRVPCTDCVTAPG
jgi:hypothetical protein